MVAAWPRPNYVLGGSAGEIALIALTRVKLPEPLPISRQRHGMPDDSEGPEAIALVARDRGEDPAWFVEQVVAPFADLIVSDLGAEAAAAALASEHAYVIEGRIDDPDDLGHVQAAWAIAKCVCEEIAAAGASAIIVDVYAARAHRGSDVAALDADREFDVMHEVTLFFDERGDGTLAAWSLGLRKFGRPELVLLGVAPDAATDAAVLLRDLAATLAAGERVEPGDHVAAPDGRELVAERFEQSIAPEVAVDSEAVVLRAAGESADSG